MASKKNILHRMIIIEKSILELRRDIDEHYAINSQKETKSNSVIFCDKADSDSSPSDFCIYCGGLIKIRNPTGNCDHLYYPENVNKNFASSTKNELFKEIMDSNTIQEEIEEKCLKSFEKGYEKGKRDLYNYYFKDMKNPIIQENKSKGLCICGHLKCEHSNAGCWRQVPCSCKEFISQDLCEQERK